MHFFTVTGSEHYHVNKALLLSYFNQLLLNSSLSLIFESSTAVHLDDFHDLGDDFKFI